MIASSTHSSTCQIDHSPVRARAHSVAAYTSMHVNMHSYACKRPGSDTETPAPVRLHARVIPTHAHIPAPGMRTRVQAHTRTRASTRPHRRWCRPHVQSQNAADVSRIAEAPRRPGPGLVRSQWSPVPSVLVRVCGCTWMQTGHIGRERGLSLIHI